MTEAVFEVPSTLRATLEPTSEARLRVLHVVCHTTPTPPVIETLATNIEGFVQTYEGRLVVTLAFDGDEVVPTQPMILSIAGRISTAPSATLKKIKGVLVKPRAAMGPTEEALKNLFVRMAPLLMRKAFQVTCDTEEERKFVQRLVAREAQKRAKRAAH